MAPDRFHIDCREMPSEMDCSLALVADSRDELIDAAAQHAVAVHGHVDGDELRTGLAGAVHEGTAPAARS